MDTGDSRGESSVSSESRAEDAVLETGWVLKVNVQLAVLSVFGDSNARAERGDECIEDDSEAKMYQRDVHEVAGSKLTNVVRSAEMKEPTVPWGQPVPP